MSVKAETALILSDFGGFHKMIMTKYQKKTAGLSHFRHKLSHACKIRRGMIS